MNSCEIIEKNIFLIALFNYIEGRFKNTDIVIGEIYNDISFVCNFVSSKKTFSWIVSSDGSQLNSLESDNRTIITNNGQQLTIHNLTLSDQQYYACLDGSNFVGTFRLIVRSISFILYYVKNLVVKSFFFQQSSSTN